ncbi:MAG: oligoendopeptidase F [Christensenellales bacterium]|jgi:oligoendopeptidase F
MTKVKTAVLRNEIDNKYKWKLEDLMDDAGFEKGVEELKKLMPALEAAKGSLDSGADSLLLALDMLFEAALLVERLYVYAHMREDQDNGDSKYQGMAQRALSLEVDFSAKTSFVTPEIISIPNERLMEFMNSSSKYDKYRHFLTNLMRSKEHVLDEAREELLAQAGEMSAAPKNVFSVLTNVDTRFPNVKNEDGEEVELSHARYVDLMRSTDREVRKNAFEKYYGEFTAKKNTLASILSASIKGDVFFAKARKYESCLDAALFHDNVPKKVYDSLIEAAHDKLPALYRYLELKKKALDIDDMHMYDIYAPISDEKPLRIPYEEAVDIVLSGLAPLGEEYVGIAADGFKNGWVDVYENRGKTSGAYCWGSYGTHPYMLLNYQDNMDNAFTIAHELGHAMHSYYSDSAQPYPTAQYTIMTAEVASTVNEVLLNHYLLERTSNRQERIQLLNHYLEQFRTTVYRQVMFAEFEKLVHEMAEEGKPLNSESICALYMGLNKLYHGEGVVSDEQIACEWSRVPHFYNSFYVYKYATGFSAAVSIASDILAGKENALENYLAFLKSGGSDYPINLLKKAGVDLATPEPVDNCLSVFAGTLDELEKLI